jgi:hypothetical protein
MSTTITAAVVRTHKAPLTIETLQLDDIRPNEARAWSQQVSVTQMPSYVTAFIRPLCLLYWATKAQALSSRSDRP